MLPWSVKPQRLSPMWHHACAELQEAVAHSRLRAWGALAWEYAPASLVDCFGESVPVHHPAILQGTDTDVGVAAWAEDILQRGPASSPKVRAARLPYRTSLRAAGKANT
eukprot:COSAG02_NODE_4436_length_5358_cov_26.782278_6_plen_109_part_00